MRRAPYRIPWGYREELRAQIAELMSEGMIRHSTSAWNSPALFVSRADRLVPRLCCDFRSLNVHTKKNASPLARIDELLLRLGKAKRFTKLDLKSGFHQIPLDEKSREYTAFSTPEGQYEWCVIPFGITNGPSTCVAIMSQIFERLEGIVAIYVDDLVIFSDNEERHIVDIETVLNNLKEFGLVLHPKKCEFNQIAVTFAGYHIKEGEISATHEQVDKLSSFPRPKTVRETDRKPLTHLQTQRSLNARHELVVR